MYIMAMKIQINPIQGKAGQVLVVPHGSIDNDTYTEFDQKLKHLLSPATQNIIMDLADVEYISSAGLGVIFNIKKYLVSNNGDLFFCNLKPQIKRLFEIVKALPTETLFKTREEADEYLYNMMNRVIDEENKKRSP